VIRSFYEKDLKEMENRKRKSKEQKKVKKAWGVNPAQPQIEPTAQHYAFPKRYGPLPISR
jgi:hypothetical protein